MHVHDLYHTLKQKIGPTGFVPLRHARPQAACQPTSQSDDGSPSYFTFIIIIFAPINRGRKIQVCIHRILPLFLYKIVTV